MYNIYEPDFVRRLFNSMSSSYERMNYITSFGFSLIWRKQFINTIVSSDKQLNVLDLMSGLGENWEILIQKFPNSNFYALDFSEKMVASSSLKNEKKLNNIFDILHKDVLNDEHPNEHFDVITCAFGLKTFDETQLDILAQCISQMLKVGGQFTFIEISVPPNKILFYFYKLYLSKIIPLLGRLFLGNPADYRLLWLYTENFRNTDKARLIFEKNGLNASFKNYFFGCATGIKGFK